MLTSFSEEQSNLSPGDYVVELLDGNGCLTSVEVEVPYTQPANVDFIYGPEVVCFPGAVVGF